MRIPSVPPALRVLLVVLVFFGLGYPIFTRENVVQAGGHSRGTSQWPPTSVKIAVPWTDDGRPSLIQGVMLAHEELDAAGGPLSNRIQINFLNESETPAGNADLARRIADDPEIVAVIGHEEGSSSMQAAVTYEGKGVLHLAPKATLSRLTKHRFQYTFRLVPNDDLVAVALVQYAKEQGWKHIGILYARVEESEALAREFSLQAIQEGMVPAYFRSYLQSPNYQEEDFRPMLASVAEHPADAILLADRLPWAAKMLKDMRTMGMKQPVMSGDKLDSSLTLTLAGKAAERVHMVGFVDPGSTEPLFAAFRERFHKRFGSNPGYGAAQGYEAFNLFARAVERSRSTSPIVVATTIRTNTWNGIFGQLSFSNSGEPDGHEMYIKRPQNGRIVVVKEIKQERKPEVFE